MTAPGPVARPRQRGGRRPAPNAGNTGYRVRVALVTVALLVAGAGLLVAELRGQCGVIGTVQRCDPTATTARDNGGAGQSPAAATVAVPLSDPNATPAPPPAVTVAALPPQAPAAQPAPPRPSVRTAPPRRTRAVIRRTPSGPKSSSRSQSSGDGDSDESSDNSDEDDSES